MLARSGGFARCGHCHQVFDARQNLLDPHAGAQSAEHTPSPAHGGDDRAFRDDDHEASAGAAETDTRTEQVGDPREDADDRAGAENEAYADDQAEPGARAEAGVTESESALSFEPPLPESAAAHEPPISAEVPPFPAPVFAPPVEPLSVAEVRWSPPESATPEPISPPEPSPNVKPNAAPNAELEAERESQTQSAPEAEHVPEVARSPEAESAAEAAHLHAAQHVPEHEHLREPEHLSEPEHLQEPEHLPEPEHLLQPEQPPEHEHLPEHELLPEAAHLPEPEHLPEAAPLPEAEPFPAANHSPETERRSEPPAMVEPPPSEPPLPEHAPAPEPVAPPVARTPAAPIEPFPEAYRQAGSTQTGSSSHESEWDDDEPRFNLAAGPAPDAEPHLEPSFAAAADDPRVRAAAAPPIFAEPPPSSAHERHFAVTREARAKSPSRVLGYIVGGIIALALVVVLIAQLAWWRREAIMVYWPDSQALFARACAQLGCRLTPPRDIDGLQVEASDLRQIDGPHRLELRVPLRNRYGVALAYPAIELTLFDSKNEVAIRRILWPQDYAPPGTTIAAGLPAHATQTMIVRLDSGNAIATNFRVQIFYP
jgi:hypothetical protein